MHKNYTMRKLRVAALLITIFHAYLMSGSGHNTRLKLVTSLDPAETLGKGRLGQFQELLETITFQAIVIK